MLQKIVLIGAGGFGREVAGTIIRMINIEKPTYQLLGFLDDGKQYHDGMMIDGYPWLGNHNWILDHKEDVVCTCTIANAEVKAIIQRELTEKGVQFETLRCPEPYTYVAPWSKIGPGCVIYGSAEISVNCRLGAGVVLNSGVKIGHDVIIGDYTTIMPDTGISGNCVIGEKVEIGGHAYIIPGRKVGDDAKIAAGSIVFTHVKAGTTVLGNPAKRMRELE